MPSFTNRSILGVGITGFSALYEKSLTDRVRKTYPRKVGFSLCLPPAHIVCKNEDYVWSRHSRIYCHSLGEKTTCFLSLKGNYSEMLHDLWQSNLQSSHHQFFFLKKSIIDRLTLTRNRLDCTVGLV
jgi:hypothetical protein